MEKLDKGDGGGSQKEVKHRDFVYCFFIECELVYLSHAKVRLFM